MKNEIAILIAAGKGERMRPLTLKTPKPLVKVHGIPMIETMIEGLIRRGVKKVYITVGYLKEQFEYLAEKYGVVSLIYNLEYKEKNNISSIYAARHVIGMEDCFICEADIFLSDTSIFDRCLKSSCYYGKMVRGYSKDWVFSQDENGRITGIGKGGSNKYNMCGICFLKKQDATIIRDAVVAEYCHIGQYEDKFWDDIVNQEINKLYMTVVPVENNQIVEIDTIDELVQVDPDYKEENK